MENPPKSERVPSLSGAMMCRGAQELILDPARDGKKAEGRLVLRSHRLFGITYALRSCDVVHRKEESTVSFGFRNKERIYEGFLLRRHHPVRSLRYNLIPHWAFLCEHIFVLLAIYDGEQVDVSIHRLLEADIRHGEPASSSVIVHWFPGKAVHPGGELFRKSF